jgi:hypothetical protein
VEGCDLRQVSERFGEKTAGGLLTRAMRYVNEGKMEMREGLHGNPDRTLILTREGKLLADGIAADLFVSAQGK